MDNNRSSDILVEEIPFTSNEKPDFIKKFHVTKDSTFNLIMIYENQFKIRLSTFHGQKVQKGNVDEDKMDIQMPNEEKFQQQIVLSTEKFYKDINFQTVPYDVVSLKKKNFADEHQSFDFIASSRNMPVRIYEVPKDRKPLNYCTFKDNKPNSESFLSPLQFSVKVIFDKMEKNDKVIGVGRKFCSVYDCEKIKTSRIKAFDKIHLSTVQLLSDQSTALIGDFIGKVYFVDLREENQKISDNHFKPHVDAVFHVKSFTSDENLFLSSARKDNFTYLFDRRNLSTFVSFIEVERNSNQRYGLCTQGDKFAIGTQNGSIFINDINKLKIDDLKATYHENNFFQDSSKVNVTDLSIISTNDQQNEILYSLGTRFYESQDQEIGNNQKVMNIGLKRYVEKINKQKKPSRNDQ